MVGFQQSSSRRFHGVSVCPEGPSFPRQGSLRRPTFSRVPPFNPAYNSSAGRDEVAYLDKDPTHWKTGQESARMPATLHSLPPEIRQVIFRHLFQGNVIKVKLRLTHRAPAGRKVNKSWKGCASKHRLETEVPDILLACKIFYEEGLKVFYQQSTLHLDNLNVQDPRSDKCCAMSWTRSYLEASAPRVCLEQVSQMIVVGGWESNAQQMVEAMPSLREVELPEVWVDKITKEWKLFSNTVMIQELEMEAFYPERYWEIAARLPHISFKGHILIKDEDREAGEVSEVCTVAVTAQI